VFDLPKPVWLLGWVSLATDAATEAIYPLLPFFLTRVLGAGAVSLGILEGAAEAVNSILKVASGRLADRSQRKRPLVLFGYGVSSIARPFIAITTTWTQVFLVRVLDRVGKGVRSAPRDAMLAMWTTPTTRGKVYGFHRSMDHLGAVVGPALASLFLWFYPEQYRTLFALTIVPGAIAVALIFFVPEGEVRLKPDTTYEKASVVESPVAPGSSRSPERQKLPREFTAFMLVLTLFTLGNSTDAFLLLHANAHHMAVVIESLEGAVDRIAQSGLTITAIKRLPAKVA
jgi:MFS family permease